jgi:hypothetical protein
MRWGWNLHWGGLLFNIPCLWLMLAWLSPLTFYYPVRDLVLPPWPPYCRPAESRSEAGFRISELQGGPSGTKLHQLLRANVSANSWIELALDARWLTPSLTARLLLNDKIDGLWGLSPSDARPGQELRLPVTPDGKLRFYYRVKPEDPLAEASVDILLYDYRLRELGRLRLLLSPTPGPPPPGVTPLWREKHSRAGSDPRATFVIQSK